MISIRLFLDFTRYCLLACLLNTHPWDSDFFSILCKNLIFLVYYGHAQVSDRASTERMIGWYHRRDPYKRLKESWMLWKSSVHSPVRQFKTNSPEYGSKFK
jgi:hypothetical protein